MISKRKKLIVVLVLSFVCIFMAACSATDGAADPGLWGYNCTVTYDALGGLVNAREIRTTYYLSNSYVFEPSGSSDMLVEPSRDGYILAGWYTAKTDSTDGVTEYDFLPTDRWDFNLDRVQDDMTLYARWLPRGKVDYIDADTGEILFTKNITSESPIQPLSNSVLQLNAPEGTTLDGYYADAACTQAYDFDSYMHVEPNPTETQLYEQLYELFPQYIEKIEYVEPDGDEETSTENVWLFLNKLGYNLLTTDEAAIAEIRAAKDALVETYIADYLVNTNERAVYLKFIQGNYITVDSVEDLKMGAMYGLYDYDVVGNPISGYILNADIDLAGVSFAMSESFSGEIIGNGHILKNLTVAVSSKKIDMDEEKTVGLTAVMDGATINDLIIENAELDIQVNSGIKVTGGLLAATARNVTFNNCQFIGLEISSGKGDDGAARYVLGDLFGAYEDCTFNNCVAEAFVIDVARPDRLVLAIFEIPVEPETISDGIDGDTTEP